MALSFRRNILFGVFILFATLISCGVSDNSTEENATYDLDKTLGYIEWEGQNGFSGLISVKEANKPAVVRAFGFSNREKLIDNQLETIFDIGSLTKQFTATAILKLEEQGKLSTNDSISRFLGQVPEDKASITIHQLLTHTAGFPRSIGSDSERLDRKIFIERALATKLDTTPGAAFRYSHMSYSLLGAIIEIASGTSYEKYLRQYLFTPAGMKNTGYVLPQWNFELMAHGYNNCTDWGKPTDMPWAVDGPFWNLRANAGILSTMQDMMLWDEALKGSKIISIESKEKLYNSHVRESRDGRASNSNYGYGWVILESPRNTKVYTHEGGNERFFSDWVRYPVEDVTIIILTNDYRRGNRSIAYEISKTIFWENYQPKLQNRKTVCLDSLPGNIMGNYAGSFLKMMTSGASEDRDYLIDSCFSAYFLNKHGVEKLTNILDRIQQQSGPSSLKQVRVINDRILEMDLERNKDQQNMVLNVYYDSEEAYLIRGFYFDVRSP